MAEHLDAVEARICRALAGQILAAGFAIRVIGGEPSVSPITRDRDEVLANTGKASRTIYQVHDWSDRQGGWVRVGAFMLAHGKGEGIVTDRGFNPQVPELEALFDRWIEVATG